MRRNMNHVAQFAWMPVMGKNHKLRVFHCPNLNRAAKLPVMTHKEAAEKWPDVEVEVKLPGLEVETEMQSSYRDYGTQYIIEKDLIDLIVGDLQDGYPDLPDKVVEATRKWVKETLPKTKVISHQNRTRCRNPVCKRGPGRGFRAKAALFYPSEAQFDPYCSKECRAAHLKKAGWKFIRDTNGNLLRRYKKKCNKCGKTFWGPKTRKRCPACIKKQK